MCVVKYLGCTVVGSLNTFYMPGIVVLGNTYSINIVLYVHSGRTINAVPEAATVYQVAILLVDGWSLLLESFLFAFSSNNKSCESN